MAHFAERYRATAQGAARLRILVHTGRMALMRPMKIRKRILSPALTALFAFSCLASIQAQSATWSERMANATIERWPEGHFAPAGAPWRWNYELGTLLEGMDAVWYGSAKGEYYR